MDVGVSCGPSGSERIFRDEADRLLFYQTLGEACERTGWRVHAWVLMSNHYHLMVETPEANLVAGMRWLQNTYTRRHNCRHGLWGRLFGDRYKAILSEGRSGYYYCSVMKQKTGNRKQGSVNKS